MTLFDTAPAPAARAAARTVGSTKPTGDKYTAKSPRRCHGCEEVAFESLRDGKGFDGMRNARFTRRQDGVTRLLCHAHASAQRAEDREKFGGEES